MALSHTVFVCVLAAAALAGCKKADAPPAPQTSSSVAAPASSLPPSDSSMQPVTPSASSTATTSNGDANAPAQNNPSTLSKEQESASMPLSGQVNNHSTANPNNDKGN